MAAHTLEQQPAPPPRRAHLPLSADESARGQHTRRDQGRGHVHHSFAACRGPPLVLVPRPPARPSRCAPWTPTTPRVRATAPAAETDMDVLSRVASDAAAAGESSGGPGTGESSSGGHTPASNKRRGTNAAKRGRENVNGKGHVKGASGGASRRRFVVVVVVLCLFFCQSPTTLQGEELLGDDQAQAREVLQGLQGREQFYLLPLAVCGGRERRGPRHFVEVWRPLPT